MRYKKGFTLIELIMVVCLIGLVFTGAGYVLNTGQKSLKAGTRDYTVQSDLRLAAQTALSKIRYSQAIYGIPKSSFRYDNLDTGWNYFGIEEITLSNGSAAGQIVEYVWNEALGKHNDAKVIAPPVQNVEYSFVFSKNAGGGGSGLYDNNLLSFRIEGYLNGDASNPYIVIDGEALANNAPHVINYGTSSDPAAAIAYRNDITSDYVGHVAMLLDCSGSMNRDIQGNEPAKGPKRIDMLKKAVKPAFTMLEAYDNIDISLIPFSNSANKPKPFLNTKLKRAELMGQINALTVDGGTNTGDAFRRAYYQLRDHSAPAGKTAKNYVILLVDGDTTLCSKEDVTYPGINPGPYCLYYDYPLYTEYEKQKYNVEDGDLLNPSTILRLYTYSGGYGGYRKEGIDHDQYNPTPNQVTGGGHYGGDYLSIAYLTGTADILFQRAVNSDTTNFFYQETDKTQFMDPEFDIPKPYLIALAESIHPSVILGDVGEEYISDAGLADIIRAVWYIPPQVPDSIVIDPAENPVPDVYFAHDTKTLEDAFTAIMKDVARDVWYSNGPEL